MSRILFVDADPAALAELQHRLHPHHDEWDMHFVGSGQDAIDALSGSTFDVVVTDAAMPGVDGAAVLAHAKREHASTVRIIVARPGAAPTSLAVAHQVLPKPCDAFLMRSVIVRSLDLRNRLSDPNVLDILGSLPSLPSPSAAMVELQSALSDANVDSAKVARVVHSDVAMSTKLLQVVNSSYYGLSRTIDDAGEAVRLLGAILVGEILLTVGLLDTVAGRSSAVEQQLAQMRERSLVRAELAGTLAELAGRPPTTVRRVWNGAFLVDIGEMLLFGTEREHDPEAQALRPVIGGALLAMWGLPQHLVETVALHDVDPESSSSELHLYAWLAAAFLRDPGDQQPDDELVAHVVRWTGLSSADLSRFRQQPVDV